MKNFLGLRLVVLPVLLLGNLTFGLAEEDAAGAITTEAAAAGGGSSEDLAKASQNPVGDLISVPFENNFYFGIGPSDSTLYAMIAKPVVPVNLGEWNLINRFVIPLLYTDGQDTEDINRLIEDRLGSVQVPFTSGGQPDLGSAWGIGDITWQGFFTPADPGEVIVGLGPAVTFPTHTEDRFGTDKWSAGPALVVLSMPGNWVFGGLVQHSWSFAGPDDAGDVNKTTLQYFVNYNFGDGWYLTSSPVFTANWEADSGQRWTVPIGGGIGKLHKFGNQPVDFKFQSFYNLESPDMAADWSVQFTVKLLFPK